MCESHGVCECVGECELSGCVFVLSVRRLSDHGCDRRAVHFVGD